MSTPSTPSSSPLPPPIPSDPSSYPSSYSPSYSPSYSLRPRFRSLLLAFLVHHNPFYLLSALCMIAGCYALNGALDLRTYAPKMGEVWKVLVLLGVINVYELLLIALGVFLIRGRGVLRDGRTLLLIQLIFLADLMFLNVEIANADWRTGAAVNAALLVLAWAKMAAVLWGLGPPAGRFPARLFTLIAVQLAALYAVPSLFAWFDRGGAISGRQVYAAWWIVGLLPAFAELQRRLAGPVDEETASLRPRIGTVYAVAAFVSLLVHMGMMHWVYRVRFVPADAAPVLLGLALAAHGARPSGASKLFRPGDIWMVRLLLPAAAVMVSFVRAPDLGWTIGRGGRLDVTPAVLTAAAAYGVYLYVYLSRVAPLVIAGTAAAAGVLLFGPTLAQVEAGAASGWRWSAAWAVRVLPQTAAGWGAVAVAGAFAFLGIGAAVSLSQGRVAEAKGASDAQPPTGGMGGGPPGV